MDSILFIKFDSGLQRENNTSVKHRNHMGLGFCRRLKQPAAQFQMAGNAEMLVAHPQLALLFSRLSLSLSLSQ